MKARIGRRSYGLKKYLQVTEKLDEVFMLKLIILLGIILSCTSRPPQRLPSSPVEEIGWQEYILKKIVEPMGLEKFFPDSRALGPWQSNDDFVINKPVSPTEIPVRPLACESKNLYPTHPYQSTKEYIHAAFSMYDHRMLSPDSYACLTPNPTRKFCLRGATALLVVMSDTYEDDCGNFYRGYWLLTYLKSDESMGTLFSKGRVLYEKPDAEFPGEYDEAGTYIVKSGDFFLLGDLLPEDRENIRVEEERALRDGFKKSGKLYERITN